MEPAGESNAEVAPGGLAPAPAAENWLIKDVLVESADGDDVSTMRGARRGQNGCSGFEGMFLSISRRKRGLVSRRVRGSVWGLNWDVRQLDQSLGQGLEDVKGNGNNASGNGCALPRIRLRVKLGKDDGKSVVEAEVIHSSVARNRVEECKVENEKLNNVNVSPADKDSVGTVGSSVSLGRVDTDSVDVEASGEGVNENGDREPVASPDSEVSNFVPERKLGGRSVVGNGNKAKPPKKRDGRVKCSGDACTDEIVASSASANGSTNSSSSKELTQELLPFLGEIDVSNGDEGQEAQTSLDGDLKGVELQDSEPPVAKTKSKGQRRQRKSNGASKKRSTTPGPKSRQRTGSARKGNENKAAGKNKAKEKNGCDNVDKIEHDSEAGNCLPSENGEAKESVCVTSSNAGVVSGASSGVIDPASPLDNAWVRCDDCLKWRRISEQLADSIGLTNCRWVCGDNMDKAFADCSIPQEMSNSEINAELGIPDADEEAFGAFSKSLASECSHTDSKEHEFMRISNNQFLHRRRKTQSIDEIMVCGCKPPPDGGLGCRDGCLNRVLNIECIPGTCPCGDVCSNQQFHKRSYSKMKWDRCGKKGFGLRLEENISRGQFLIEYVGEVLDMRNYQAWLKEYASMGHKHFYFMTLDGSEVIDACAKGNLGRFINHSCDPNCRTEKWVVNGEICIGLFALRDIKKGEEVTFDYNYVRVVGAAAKQCYCGSLHCRGYIGGDPINSDFIDQVDSDEEFPEPVMLERRERSKGDMTRTKSLDGVDMQVSDGMLKAREIVKSINTIGDAEITSELDDFVNDQSAVVADSKRSSFSGQPTEILSQDEDASTGPLLDARPEMAIEETVSKTSHAIQISAAPLDTESNPPSDCVAASEKSKSASAGVKRVFVKSRFYLKSSDQSYSMNKGKHLSNQSNTRKAQIVAKRSEILSWKSKKLMEAVANGRFEAVEEKLNELLDVDGGICRKKDAPRGYLQLLHLTAASGSNGNGETIQRNRDLSMLLDAILKTKSRTVLTDIVDKNVLQKLHNMMKQCRRDFKKMPILRKVLKVLEYLASREILTLEHICKGPPHPGVESFIESMLSLTEHDDKQAHQIARNFRDRWIPRHVRKISFLDRDDERKKIFGGGVLASPHHWPDQPPRPTELINTLSKLEPPTSSAASSVGGTARIRKRKTRWDQDKPVLISVLEDEPIVESGVMQQPESKRACYLGGELFDHSGKLREDGYYIRSDQSDTLHHSSAGADTRMHDSQDDIPPGFSSPHSKQISSVSLLTETNMAEQTTPDGLVIGHPQKRFLSCLPVSYGIPLAIAQQLGSPRTGSLESWVIAPGMVFHPFPPLPPVSRPNKEAPPSVGSLSIDLPEAKQGDHKPACYLTEDSPSTSGSYQCGLENADANLRHASKRPRGLSHDLGRRYFRQQKWNRPPPWIRNGTQWGYVGNNSRGGICPGNVGSFPKEHRALSFAQDAVFNPENIGNYYHQEPEQLNEH